MKCSDTPVARHSNTAYEDPGQPVAAAAGRGSFRMSGTNGLVFMLMTHVYEQSQPNVCTYFLPSTHFGNIKHPAMAQMGLVIFGIQAIKKNAQCLEECAQYEFPRSLSKESTSDL